MRGLCWSLVAMTVHKSMSSTIPWEAWQLWSTESWAKKRWWFPTLVLHKIETLKNGTSPFHHPCFFCFASCLFSTCFHPFCWKLPFVVLKKPGYATKEDALLVRVDRNGALKTSKYCGDEPPREAPRCGHAGISYSCTKQKKRSSRHEVRGVCFWWFVLVFFLISPVALTSVDHKGRSKSIAFLLVFSCPIDKDFLIQFLIVQTNP